MSRFAAGYVLPALFFSSARAQDSNAPPSAAVDLSWHAPNQTWINDITQVVNGSGTYGFHFGGSTLPADVKYGTYNWCNMPHVREDMYPDPPKGYELTYVELIHRHHKRTPYANNTFPREGYSWECTDEGLSYYGSPLNPQNPNPAQTYWFVHTSEVNPFAPKGFNGSCQFPQITRAGLEDSWQHGKDLYQVYHSRLHGFPAEPDEKVSFRVTSNAITSQVAGMVISGMFPAIWDGRYPVNIQPSSIDSLEPAYSCPASNQISGQYGAGSSNPAWTGHLSATADLFRSLDVVSGVSSSDSEWHRSFDHYYDNLSTRQCHQKPLPCKIGSEMECVTQAQANEVYRLGQYEYSYLYRDSPESLEVAKRSYGVWVAELARNMRDHVAGVKPVVYMHNIAHDGSVSLLLAILQIDVMAWPGMGAEVVFEMYKNGDQDKRYVRVLFGGQVLTSSNPSLGEMDMIELDILLDYFDGLVGANAAMVPTLCANE
ncbi:phosphoglycerate mutase-like protein [Eremomyces bilateralis CBS 781.70]|uniref:Phosphoglycerate mutase-like protein n=1 Tax=Eremomyces bilateralis CBS 781.70 TaxID=1392243 RepID=A0A6G1FZD3_9PEZI|nr:phosphoglycerate mutase-like protein [Eremomyces bilateralis CBS 781.70]KAF1811030.1 phosphoglycerate mutase-like protein [Eremomyces bilateralis CBS 781.70]